MRQARRRASVSLASLATDDLNEPLCSIAERKPNPEIARLKAEIEEALQPAGPNAALVAMEMVRAALQVAIPPDEAIPAYQAVLGELPWDLLDLATHRVIREYVYPSFPKPGDWINRVTPELEQRQGALARARMVEGRRRIALRYYPQTIKKSGKPEAKP